VLGPGRRRRWPQVLVGIVALVVVLAACSALRNSAKGTSYGGSAASGTPASSADAANAEGVAAQSGPLTTFGDGKWEIGIDIVEGKYKTSGPSGSGICYLDTEDDGGDIDQQEVSHGPVTMTIKKSDHYFTTSGCADWRKVG
jgi:hypothetical protein